MNSERNVCQWFILLSRKSDDKNGLAIQQNLHTIEYLLDGIMSRENEEYEKVKIMPNREKLPH